MILDELDLLSSSFTFPFSEVVLLLVAVEDDEVVSLMLRPKKDLIMMMKVAGLLPSLPFTSELGPPKRSC